MPQAVFSAALLGARRSTVLLSVALIGITAVFVWPAFAHAYDVWSTTEEFSFGFLVVPISVALLVLRRARIREAGLGSSGAQLGLVITGLAAVAYIGAERAEIHAVAGLSVPPLLWGIVVYVFGWPMGREVAFPIGFLAFGLGLFRGLLDSVGFALQSITALGTAALAHVVGLSVVRDGLVLTSERFSFVVAESCSGMSSLVSLLALAALLTYWTRGSLSGHLVVLLSVLPLVVLSNTLRVTLVLVVASVFGQDAALGFFHGASSLVLFGTALAGLLLVSRSVGCRAPNSALSL